MKRLTPLTVVVVGLFIGFGTAQASTIASQTDDSSQTTLIMQESYQSLGSGLSGLIDQEAYKINFPATVTHTYRIDTQLIECDTNALTTVAGAVCTVSGAGKVASSTTNVNGMNGTNEIFATLTTTGGIPGYNLNPTKYYFITWNPSPYNDSQAGYLYGSTNAGSYPAGSLNAFNAESSIAPLNDAFFILTGTVTAGGSSYVTNIIPNTSSTTATTYVETGFNYHADSGNNINSYVMTFNDVTNGSSFDLTGSATTGDNVVTRYVTLNSGDLYNLSVNICSTSGACFSGYPAQQFAVVSNTSTSFLNATSTGKTLFGNDATTTLQNSLNGCAQIDNLFGNAICIAFSWLFVPDASTFTGFGSLIASIKGIIPFSYLFEIYGDLGTISNSSDASSSPSTVINFTNLNCTGAWSGTGDFTCDPAIKSWLPASITLFSTTSMAAVLSPSTVSFLKSAFEIALLVSFGIFWFYRILGFWNTV